MTPKPLLVLAALGAGILAFHAAGFRINLSASMPAGLYRLGPCGKKARADLELGDLVVIDTELAARMNPAVRFFRERGYLSFTGSADDLLMKRVVGVGGEWVQERAGVLVVGGRALSAEASERVGSVHGEPLPKPSLPSQVGADALWLSSEHSRGIDSRYKTRLARAVEAQRRPRGSLLADPSEYV